MRRRYGRLIFIMLIVLWSLFPIYWGLRTSLLTNNDLLAKPLKYLPLPVWPDNYRLLFGLNNGDVLLRSQFYHAFINSVISCSLASLLVIIISVPAGYAFSRMNFPGKKVIFWLVLATMAIPAYAVLIPLYKLIIAMGLLDTQTCITLIYASAFAPLAVWLMRNAFDTIPIEVEEAALIDGCTRPGAMLTILPLAMPGLIAVVAITFLSSWSQFVIPLVFSPIKTLPLTVLIAQFVGKSSINYGLMAAAGMIAIIPPAVVVLAFNRFLVSGLMTGALKR